MNVCKHTVRTWRRRFAEHRLEGLRDAARPGAPRTVEDARIEALITTTLESVPPHATHWSSRGMARASGLSVSTVQGIWRAFGLQPHRMETFKLSTDPDFVAKVRNVVGLSMPPPDRVPVLCVDEKSQSRRSTAASPCCACAPGSRRAAATISSGTAPPACSLPSRRWRSETICRPLPATTAIPTVMRNR